MKHVNALESTIEVGPSASERARCAYRDSTGRQCRNRIIASSGADYCPIHIGKIERAQNAERQAVSDELFDGAEDLNTSFTIRRFLKKLMPMIVQRRLTRGEAYLLSYISSLLLQSLGSANDELYRATDRDSGISDLAIRRSLQPFLVEILGYDPTPAVNRQIADRRNAGKPRPAVSASQPRLVAPAASDIRNPDSQQSDSSPYSGDSSRNAPNSPAPRAS